jgi:rhodanese-related sulfurtransferase
LEFPDVRTEDKYVYGHLEGAVGADYKMDTFEQRLANLNRTAHYGVYGKNRDEVAIAIRIMIRWGFKHVSNLGTLDDAQAFTHIPEVM